MTTPKIVRIECTGYASAPLSAFEELQGDLKDLSEAHYKALKSEILAEGFSFPLHVWRDQGTLRLLDGHQRTRCLKRLSEEGFEIPDLPYTLTEAEDYQQAKRKLLAAASQYGVPTEKGLIDFLKDVEIDPIRLSENFPLSKIEMPTFVSEHFRLPDEEKKEDEIPEPPKVARTKLGELWTLGRHRLMCGDSTSIDAVEKLMAGEKADMVFTDPPYGMNLDTNFARTNRVEGKTYRPVIGDDQDFDPGIIFGIFDYCEEVFLWGADYYCQHLPKGGAWEVWDKKKEDLDESIGTGFELCWSKQPHKRMLARFLWSGFTAKERNETRVHPTQKPIALCEWFFERWGKPEDKVVDLFGGSGSTLIACEKTKRRCFMMELDPFYVDVILTRWAEYTGEDPVREDGKLWSDLRLES